MSKPDIKRISDKEIAELEKWAEGECRRCNRSGCNETCVAYRYRQFTEKIRELEMVSKLKD